ncbi:aminoglycoside phosphotransferase family protein, partial [Mesorhizobium sp. M1A.T.Ca.IN.004.03.1.1]
MTTFDEFLLKNGLRSASEEAIYKPLTGGVSSDIYRVELPGRLICVKRALAKLKVSADWQAPVSRNVYEWNWIS